VQVISNALIHNIAPSKKNPFRKYLKPFGAKVYAPSKFASAISFSALFPCFAGHRVFVDMVLGVLPLSFLSIAPKLFLDLLL
jgi:hypothetical protein